MTAIGAQESKGLDMALAVDFHEKKKVIASSKPIFEHTLKERPCLEHCLDQM